MLLNASLLIVLGILLFLFLLYIIGWRDDTILKKRKEKQGRSHRGKREIVLIYILVLCTGIPLYFLLIKYLIRGVV
jgi:ABC-type Fe3+ transport system permease subunit